MLNAKKDLDVRVSELFHIRKDLRELWNEQNDGSFSKEKRNFKRKRDDVVEEKHPLDLLLRFMDGEFDGIVDTYLAMKNEHCVSWDMLWEFFPPSETIVYHCATSDEEVCGVAKSTNYTFRYDGTPIFKVSFIIYNYNCKTWMQCALS